MQLGKPSKMNERDTRTKMQLRDLTHRPVPLFWGIVAFLLFVGFAVVAQLQFKRLYDDKVHAAQMDSYENALKVYENDVASYNDCVTSIEVRDTYRTLFAGVEDMFERTANLPVTLFPESEEALSYQKEMLRDLTRMITTPIADSLPAKTLVDCPPMPKDPPERPRS